MLFRCLRKPTVFLAGFLALISAAAAQDAQTQPESLIYSGNYPTGPFTFVNNVMGWADYFNAGYLGASTVIGNVEAGHIWFGHEVFKREPWATTGFTTFTNTAALNELDFHATMVGHVLAGSGYVAGTFPPQYTYVGLGMAPQAALMSASVATEFSPTSIGSFDTTYESVITPYKAFFTGTGVAKADVINSSWGGYDPAAVSPEPLALDGLSAGNPTVAFVASAGNSDVAPVGSPASNFNNIAVGSLGGSTFLVPSEFSSRGLVDFYNPVTDVLTPGARVAVDIAAPGELMFLAAYLGDSGSLGAANFPYVQTQPPTDQYFVNMDGTSFSSPIVAGGVALLKDVAKTHPWLNLAADTNALDTRVVKSVLMAGALETAGWNNAQTAGSNGVVSTTQALDAVTGAGAFNLSRSTDAYFFGTTDVNGTRGGAIAQSGWDFGTVGLGASNDYFFGSPFRSDVELTVSLNWFAGRSFDAATNIGSDLSFADLNLEVWTVKNGVMTAPVARSLTTYNNAEFLRVDLLGGQEYGLRVTLPGMVYDMTGAVASESYGLSWITSTFNTLYWDPNGATAGAPASATGTWSGTNAFWNTSESGTGGSLFTTTTGLDQLVFSAGTNAVGAGTITVDGPQLARGIILQEGTLTFVGTNGAGIHLNSGGLTMASAVDGDATIAASVPVMISGSQSWSNASTHSLNVAGAISGTGDLSLKAASTGAINISGNIDHSGLLANNGTGSGTNTISGVIGTNVTGLIQDSATSALVLNGSQSHQYTGDTIVRTGLLVVDFANAAVPSNLINADSRLVLGGGGGSEGGTLRVVQKNGLATTQTFDGTLVSTGASVVEGVNVGGSVSATLTINLGTITRTNGGTLAMSLPQFGSITTANGNVNGILGTWATVGTGSAARYASVSNGIVIALAGTAVSDASGITDTTGSANYDLGAGGAMAEGAAFNTMRYTGGASVLSNNFSANGLLNAGGGELGIAGNVTVGDSRSLVVNAASGAVNFTGAVTDNAGGSSSFTKAGSGIVVLGATSTYTGNTYVDQGNLRVDGSIASSAGTFVGSGAVLSGSGTVGNLTIESGGTGSPGNSPGMQTIAGNLTWTGGANYNWQIHDALGTAGKPVGWDLYNVSGVLDLTALTLGSKFNINLWSLSGIGPDVNGDALNFDYSQNYTWTIVATALGITGFNADYFDINANATNGTAGFSNDLFGGVFGVRISGNDLQLTFTTAVPEPGTWAAAAMLVVSLVAVRYRRGSSVSRRRSPR